MSSGLERFHQTGDLHFITFSCARKRPILGTPESRDTVLRILEETRAKYRFHVFGYVVMPNHVHLLVTEPEQIKLSISIQVLKQRFSRTRTEEYVWEPRYYDFNVYTEHKRVEKLRYIHRNPVANNLVAEPELWSWSSFRAYASDEPRPRPSHIPLVHKPGSPTNPGAPPFRLYRKGGVFARSANRFLLPTLKTSGSRYPVNPPGNPEIQ